MRNFSGFMGDVAGLLLKSQAELNRLVDSLPDFYPRPDAPAAQSASFSLRSDDSAFSGELEANGVIRLSAVHGPLSYWASFPTRVADIAEFSATVLLGNGDWRHKLTLNGVDFFDAKGIAPEFVELHEKVLDAAKRHIPGLRGRTGELARDARNTAEQAAKAARQQNATARAGVEETAPQGDAPAGGEAASRELCEVLIRRPGERDLRFKGELLAGVRTTPGLVRGWDLRVYRTAAGKFVAIQAGLSSILGECDRVEVKVLDRLEDVTGFFGATNRAKALYRDLNLSFEEYLE
jgi:hypothetical protein